MTTETNNTPQDRVRSTETNNETEPASMDTEADETTEHGAMSTEEDSHGTPMHNVETPSQVTEFNKYFNNDCFCKKSS